REPGNAADRGPQGRGGAPVRGLQEGEWVQDKRQSRLGARSIRDLVAGVVPQGSALPVDPAGLGMLQGCFDGESPSRRERPGCRAELCGTTTCKLSANRCKSRVVNGSSEPTPIPEAPL